MPFPVQYLSVIWNVINFDEAENRSIEAAGGAKLSTVELNLKVCLARINTMYALWWNALS